MLATQTYAMTTFGVALPAAAFDWRTGRIPNLLTVGALAVAFPLHAWLSPPGRALEGVQWAALATFLCAFPLVVGWRLGWVAGGDVKLIAAMSATGGMTCGIEAVFLSMLCAVSWVFLRLCYQGVFFRTLANGVAVAVNRTILRGPKLPVRDELTSTLRFGPYALAGAAITLALHGGLI